MALDPLKFIALFTQHILPPGQKTIFYFGFYSNKSRGMRGEEQAEQREIIVVAVPRSSYRKNWRRLLIKVFAAGTYQTYGPSKNFLARNKRKTA